MTKDLTQLEPNLETLIEQLRTASDEPKSSIIDKIFNLTIENVAPHIIDILKCYEAPYEDKLIHLVSETYLAQKNGSINLPLETLQQISQINNHIYFKSFLEFTTKPLIESLNDDLKSKLSPAVCKLLAKTYVDIEDLQEKINLALELSNNLEKILNANDSLNIILQHSIDCDGNFYITNKGLDRNIQGELQRDIVGHFNIKFENIYIDASERKITDIVVSLMHESTHKVIQNLYDNDCNPFKENDYSVINNLNNFIRNASSHFDQEVDLYMASTYVGRSITDQEKSIYNKLRWLDIMKRGYDYQSYNSELFAWFVQHLSQIIITEGNSDLASISVAGTKQTWEYLQTLVIDPLAKKMSQQLSSQEMPQCLIIKAYQEATSDVAIQAKKMLHSEEPIVEWLYSDAGIIAFDVLSEGKKMFHIRDFLQQASEDSVNHILGTLLELKNLDYSTVIVNFNKLKPTLWLAGLHILKDKEKDENNTSLALTSIMFQDNFPSFCKENLISLIKIYDKNWFCCINICKSILSPKDWYILLKDNFAKILELDTFADRKEKCYLTLLYTQTLKEQESNEIDCESLLNLLQCDALLQDDVLNKKNLNILLSAEDLQKITEAHPSFASQLKSAYDQIISNFQETSADSLGDTTTIEESVGNVYEINITGQDVIIDD